MKARGQNKTKPKLFYFAIGCLTPDKIEKWYLETLKLVTFIMKELGLLIIFQLPNTPSVNSSI